jgi:hypothetical protein
MKAQWIPPRLTVYGDVATITQQPQTPCHLIVGGQKQPNLSDTLTMGQSQNAAGCFS